MHSRYSKEQRVKSTFWKRWQRPRERRVSVDDWQEKHMMLAVLIRQAGGRLTITAVEMAEANAAEIVAWEDLGGTFHYRLKED